MKSNEIHIRDPFILLEDGTYYLYSAEVPGFKVYKSDNLENWSEPVKIFTPDDDFWGMECFWAPEVHKYNGSYYLFSTHKGKNICRGTQIFKSDSPEGPFFPHSNMAVTPHDWECLDGTLYVEDGIPYMVFCHEWLQVKDGEMCYVQLSSDLKEAVGEPVIMFRASESPCISSFDDNGNYITDGPFLYKTKKGKLLMIWSSFAKHGYCEAIAYSDNGKLTGNWKHADKLLFEKDGGHGMIFKDKDGRIMLPLHHPNIDGKERLTLFELEEKDDTLCAKK